MQPPQPRAQLLAHPRVERAERLVEQQHLGLDRERPGERHALALAARELRRVAVGEAVEVDELRAARPPARLISAFGRLRIVSPKATLSLDRHVLERRVVLEHEADVALLRRQRGGVLAVDHDASPVSGSSSPAIMRSSVDLPLPLGPSSAVSEPVGHVERDVVEGHEVAEALARRCRRRCHRVASFCRRLSRFMSRRASTSAISASTSDAA